MAIQKPPLRDINPIKDGVFSKLWQYFFSDMEKEATLNETHRNNTNNPHQTSDNNLVFHDSTTNDVSTSKHGFAPKAPGDTTKFLRGDATWAITPGSVPAVSVVSETTFGQSTAVGTGVRYAREDHTHGTPAAPVIPDPSDTVTDETTWGITPAAGIGDKYSREDHTHGTPAKPVKVRYVPDSVTLNTGTLNSGNVASVQVPFDTNVYSVQEVTGVPGYDIEFTFIDIVNFNRINLHHAYFGSDPTHFVSIQLYNYNTSAWNHVTVFLNGANYNQWLSLEGIPDTNYISSGTVKLKYYHESSGNVTHQIAIDYVSLVQDGDI